MNRIRKSQAASGGLLLFVGVVLAASNLRAPITAVGPLVGSIRASTGLSASAIGLLTTITLLAFAAVSPFAPRLARRFGIEATLMASLLATLAGVLLRSLPSAAALFAGTALIGMAIAIANVLLPTLIKREFPLRIGLMTGVYSVAMNMWAAVASGVSVPLSESAGLGWRGSLEAWAALAAIAAVCWLPQLFAGRRVSSAAQTNGGRGSRLWRSALAWHVSLYMGLQSLLFYANVSWLPEILHDRGIPYEEAGWILSLMQFVSLPATFVTPMIATRFRSQRPFAAVIAVLFAAGFLGLLFAADSTLLATVWIMLIGIAGGAVFSLSVLFFSLRAATVQQSAELSGMAQSVGYLIAAVGPALLGFVHDASHSWTVPLIILTAIVVLNLFFGLSAGRNRHVAPPNEEASGPSAIRAGTGAGA